MLRRQVNEEDRHGTRIEVERDDLWVTAEIVRTVDATSQQDYNVCMHPMSCTNVM